MAAFCNAEEGGVIVFGARTTTPQRGGGEIISEVGGLREVYTQPCQYLQTLNHFVFPHPVGLRVDVAQTAEDRPLVLIDIAP